MIEDWDDLRDFDLRKMSVNRAFVVVMNRIQGQDDLLYVKMLELYEMYVQGQVFQ